MLTVNDRMPIAYSRGRLAPKRAVTAIWSRIYENRWFSAHSGPEWRSIYYLTDVCRDVSVFRQLQPLSSRRMTFRMQ